MPRPRPPGWVPPPEKEESGTRRADRIVRKEVVNRKLQIYLMRRAEADAVAAATAPINAATLPHVTAPRQRRPYGYPRPPADPAHSTARPTPASRLAEL